MASRPAARSNVASLNWIELPTLPHPQYVDSDGYELAEPERAGGNDDALVDGNEGEAPEEEDMKVDEADDAVMEVDVEVQEQGEPLLSQADSLVLVQSLHQTRQRHMQRLLPHVFSHPPVTSHNRPRARGPPRSTFLFPTPAPAIAPLPYKEYHGPRNATPAAATGSASPSPAPDKADTDGETQRARVRAKKAAELDEAAPAHDMECIARVTLSVGPFSYPETELWVGRFVEPRAEAASLLKAERRARTMAAAAAAGESAPKKAARTSLTIKPYTPRTTPASSSAASRPSSLLTSRATAPTGINGTRPLGTPTIPNRPPGPGQLPNQRPPLPTAPPARAQENAIDPDLIKKVNQAASTRPWLSDIIHKAARKLANKEELALLGRTVGHLKRGEDIDQEVGGWSGTQSTETLPPPGAPGPAATAASRPAALAPAAVTSASAASGATSPLTSEDDSESSLSDLEEELDMKGPPQVGGGPLPVVTDMDVKPPSAASGSASTPAALPAASTSAASPFDNNVGPRPTSPRVPSKFIHFTPKPVVPLPQVSRLSAPSASSSLAASSSSFMRPPHPTSAGISVPRTPGPPGPLTTSMAPPPPPAQTYPKPPPFLFVAFKDAPTEKYLLPLGLNSFVSRIGGDHVTHPPPIARPSPTVSAPIVAENKLASTASDPPATVLPESRSSGSIAETAKGRTRASLGRNAKDLPLNNTETKAPESPAPPEVIVPKVAVPTPPKLLPAWKPEAKPGTVIMSLMVPIDEWQRPDWDVLEKGLPWINPVLVRPSTPVPPSSAPTSIASMATNSSEAVVPQSTVGNTGTPGDTSSTKLTNRLVSPNHIQRNLPASPTTLQSKKADPPPLSLLNLGAADFLPSTGDLQPVTIRLSGLDDHAWSRVRQIMAMVENEDLRALQRAEPGFASSNQEISPLLPTSQQITPARLAYTARKRSRARHLLSRVPARKYLRFRTEAVNPALVEATTDKWAPRPYPISTKALYTRSPPPDDEPSAPAVGLSPERPAKRRKGDELPAVTFEMPVSLDALDERVEEGAKLAIGRKGKGGRPKSKAGPQLVSSKIDADGKAMKKRSKQGAICEGCALPGLNVWRKGPGGKGTLCKDCGDAYNDGTLGELKAPGAMARVKAEPRRDSLAEPGLSQAPTDPERDQHSGSVPGAEAPGPTVTPSVFPVSPPKGSFEMPAPEPENRIVTGALAEQQSEGVKAPAV